MNHHFNRGFWMVHVTVWSTFGFTHYLSGREFNPSEMVAVVRNIGSAIIGGSITLGVAWIYGMPVEVRIRWTSVVLACLAGALVWTVVQDYAYARFVNDGAFSEWDKYLKKGTLNHLTVLAAWTAGYALWRHRQELTEEQRRSLEALAQAKDAHLRVLQHQVHPHFLFNTLNTVKALVDENPEQARHLITEFSDFLRSSLSQIDRSMVRLEEETAAVQRYWRIENIRFSETLKVGVKLDPKAASCLVPGFILNPLAENAITHGLPADDGFLHVRLTTRDEDDVVRVRISNSGSLCPDFDHHGVGLDNVRERLRLAFDRRAEFTLQNGVGEVHADITIWKKL